MAWVNSSSGNVVLEWTSVGDDRDYGKAISYEGAANPSRAISGRKCSGTPLQGLPVPKSAGNKEKTIVRINMNEKVSHNFCYFP